MATSKVTEVDLGKEFIDAHADTVFAWNAFYRESNGTWSEIPERIVESELWDVIETRATQGLCKATTYIAQRVMRYVQARLALDDDDALNLIGQAPGQGPWSGAATQSEMGRVYLVNHQNTMYTRGSWYRYSNGVWEQVYEETVVNEVWHSAEQYETMGKLRPTHNIVRGVVSYIQSHVFVPEDKVDAHPDLINLQNGSYDLKQQMLLPHNAKDYLTTQLPFAYDPQAKCPTWHYYLQSSLTHPSPRQKEHDPDLALFLQEAIGYSLTTDISYHVSFWCPGEGNNGKGVLFSVLTALAGSGAMPLNIDLLKKDRYQLADLAGKRIAFCAEANVSSDNVVEDGDVKALVAGDPMNVRQIRERPFILQPQCKLWWSMNKLPVVADTSLGFWRRVRVIPFNRIFVGPEVQLDLKQRLLGELPGIFNWAMDGLQRLYVNRAFTTPQQIVDQTQEYRHDSNVVQMFVEDECLIEENAKVMSSWVYESYNNWCKRNGYRPYNARNFKREMVALGYWAKRFNTGVFFHGVRLVVSPPDPDDGKQTQMPI